jgi:tight adherence protein B
MNLAMMFFGFLAIVLVICVVVADRIMRKRDVDQMKDLVSGRMPVDGSPGKSEQAALMKSDKEDGKQRLARVFLGKNLNERLRDYLEQAGLEWDPARTLYLSLIFGVAGFNIFWYLVPRGRPISVVGAMVGLALPFFIAYRKRAARMHKFEEQFPDALEFVARAMRTGHAFSVSLEMLHKEFPPPLSDEFRRAFEEQNLGLPLEVALERLGTRVPLLDVKFFVSSVLLQKRTGGNLAALLENLSYLIRERFKLRGRIRSISAHGRISGLVLSMIPLGVSVMMFWTNPEYILFFFDDPDGKMLMVITIILQFLGFVSIKKLTDIEV